MTMPLTGRPTVHSRPSCLNVSQERSMKYTIRTNSKKLLADTVTPVNIYLKLRDVYAGSLLLESSDYHGHENSLSFICCQPMAGFAVKDGVVEKRFPDGRIERSAVDVGHDVIRQLETFRSAFQDASGPGRYAHLGLFGYMAYDAVRYFEDVTIDPKDKSIPDILYRLYKYVIVVDHFSNDLVVYEHRVDGEGETDAGLDFLIQTIFTNRFSTYRFGRVE